MIIKAIYTALAATALAAEDSALCAQSRTSRSPGMITQCLDLDKVIPNSDSKCNLPSRFV